MGQSDELKKIIIASFPGLAKDALFEITSPNTPNYNCLAWAVFYNDRWMQPSPPPHLDGVVYWWPEGAKKGSSIECLKDAYKQLGYTICNDYNHEEGIRKIALYADSEGHWTHAARERRSGCWTSKLGKFNDIQHGNPYTIEGETYGKVYCIMEKKIDE